MNKTKIARIVFAVWIFVWILYLVRPYFKQDLLKQYSDLSRLSLDGKRSYVTGKELYEFIGFCNEAVPPASAYMIIGLDKEPLDGRRAAYYLYPNIEKEGGDYVLVYKVKDFAKKGYVFFKGMDPGRYILRKAG